MGPATRPFSAFEIEDLIKSGVSQARVARLIEERGVNFEITGAVRSRLQNAGAGSNVIAALEVASGRYVKRREEAKRKEEQIRAAAEAKRKVEEEHREAEDKKKIAELKRQQEEELKRAEIEKRQREEALKREALAKKKAEEEAMRREEERKKEEEETRKRQQELARLKKLEDARKVELEAKNPIAFAPPCSVGLQHVFQYEDGTRFTRRIARRDGELCVIGQSYYDKDWTLVKQIGKDGQVITSFRSDYPLIGEKWLPFPLEVGKEWQVNYRVPSNTAGRAIVNHRNYFKVLSYEKMKTPAGTFATFKIRQEQRRGSSGWGIRYFWYAPEVEYYVKHEKAPHESSPEDFLRTVRNYELLSVSRAKK